MDDNFRPMPKKAPVKKKRGKKKKETVTAIKKRCDKLWSELIRSYGSCEICGTTENLNAHHLITRARIPTRFMKENGVCLCVKHHTFCHELSAHGAPLAFSKWFIENYGQERMDWLIELSHDKSQWKIADYRETEKDLKIMLDAVSN